MDPTLAALIGAAIGTIGTVLVPFTTARQARTARRRDVMQEAYAEGARAMADFLRVRDPNGYARVRERLFEAQNHIRLVGVRSTSVKYDHFVAAVSQLIDVATDEVTKFRPFKTPEQRTESTFPQEAREKMTAAYEEFLLAARRDIGTDGFARQRTNGATKRA